MISNTILEPLYYDIYNCSIAFIFVFELIYNHLFHFIIFISNKHYRMKLDIPTRITLIMKSSCNCAMITLPGIIVKSMRVAETFAI